MRGGNISISASLASRLRRARVTAWPTGKENKYVSYGSGRRVGDKERHRAHGYVSIQKEITREIGFSIYRLQISDNTHLHILYSTSFILYIIYMLEFAVHIEKVICFHCSKFTPTVCVPKCVMMNTILSGVGYVMDTQCEYLIPPGPERTNNGAAGLCANALLVTPSDTQIRQNWPLPSVTGERAHFKHFLCFGAYKNRAILRYICRVFIQQTPIGYAWATPVLESRVRARPVRM